MEENILISKPVIEHGEVINFDLWQHQIHIMSLTYSQALVIIKGNNINPQLLSEMRVGQLLVIGTDAFQTALCKDQDNRFRYIK
ncbi:MAG TPA: hypothetical protein PKD79_00310 [Candidatus Doudnabacteria bacterium]|nr:hypothetical protein [Candidatus Doudnabacteria bacterium]